MKNESKKEIRTPKLSIGLPVYNGEKFISQILDNLLSQTFADFELMISDNNSTDKTSEICMKYAEKDDRIRYMRQKENLGATKNFHFVLQQAKSPYFMWASADDIQEPTFIEKNLRILDSNSNLIGSISKVDFYGKFSGRYDDKNDTNQEKYRHVRPISGSYEDKVSIYLKFGSATLIYSLFRTCSLRDVEFDTIQLDFDIILHALKYGDIHVIDEVLLHRSSEGMSSVGMIYSLKSQGFNVSKVFFMYTSLISWCIKNFGIKFFIKNIRSFIRLHYIGYGRIILDFVRYFRK